MAACVTPRTCSASRRGCMRSAVKVVSLSRSPPGGAAGFVVGARVVLIEAVAPASSGDECRGEWRRAGLVLRCAKGVQDVLDGEAGQKGLRG